MSTTHPIDATRKIRLLIPEVDHREFKAWCAQNGKTLSEGLLEAVRGLIDRDAPAVHSFAPGESGWQWHQGCGCQICEQESEAVTARQRVAQS